MNADAAPGFHAAAVIDALPVALMATGPDGRLRLVNAAMAAMLGCAVPGEAHGIDLDEAIRRLAYRGILGDGPPEQCARLLREQDLAAPLRQSLRGADKRVHEWHSVPLPAGGVAVLIEESTAQLHARDRAEAALHEIQGLLARLETGIAHYDSGAKLRHSNPSYARVLGLQPGDVHPGIGIEALTDLQMALGEYGPAERDRFLTTFQAALRDGKSWSAERTRPNGRTLRFQNQPLPDGGWLAEATDISDEHDAVQEARRRADLQGVLLAALPVGVAVYGPDRTLLMVNEAYNRLYADSPVTPGENLRDILLRRAGKGEFGPGQPEALVEGRLARLHQPQVFERRRPDGSLTIHRSVPLPDGGHAMVLSDVTALQAAKAEARERAHALNTMLESTRHGIVLFDRDKRVIAANRLAAKLCGLPEDTFQPGMSLAALRAEQLRHGVYGDAEEAARFLQARGADPMRSNDRYTRSLPDGRIVEVVTDALPHGGFVRSYTDVTPLLRAQEEAKARAATLEEVLANMRHGIIMYDAQGHVLVGNRLAERLAGFPEGSIVPGVHYHDLIRLQASIGQIDAEETARRYRPGAGAPWADQSTYQRIRPDGTVLEVRTDVIPGGGGVRSFTDVTALARAEAEAASRAAMMQAMLDNMRHGIALFDAQGRLISFNRLCASLLGMEGQLRLGMTHAEMIASQVAQGEFGDDGETARHVARLREVDWAQPQAFRRRNARGVELEIVSGPVPDGGYVITITDITARVEAEHQAERRAALLESALNAARTGIALYGPDGRVVAANTLAARISGWDSGAEIIGHTVEDIVRNQAALEHPGDEAAIAEALQRFAAIDRSVPLHYQRRRANGRVLDVTSDPTPDGGFVISLSDVTELVQAREEAQRQAAALASALNATRHSITLLDSDHRIIATNRIGAEIAGFPPAESMSGMPYPELARAQAAHEYPDDPEAAAAFVARMMAMDRRTPLRYQRRTASGRVLDVTSDPTPDGGFAISLSDVTALVDAQEEAQRRSGILQAMINNSRQGVMLYDGARRLVGGNALAGEFFGLPGIEQRVGATLEDLLEAQHAAGLYGEGPEAREAVDHLMQIDRREPMRVTRVTPAGRVLSIASDPTPDGGFVVSINDVTALARAEAEAMRRAEILTVMLGNIRHGIVLFDAGGRIVASNATLQAMLGIPPEMLEPGRTQNDMVDALLAAGEYGTGEEARAVAEAIKQRARKDSIRTSRRRPDGRIVEVVSDPTPDGGWVVTYSDVTEDRHIRAELERARAAAEAANLAKSRFLATMSHELRTPLNAVIGFSEALRDEVGPEHIAEFAGAIQEAGRHLLSLIDDILDITRAEEGRLPAATEVVQPGPLLASAARMMTGQAEAARLRLLLDVAEGLPALHGDARRLRQILLNLLSNAIKFTPAEGTVTLHASCDAEGGVVMEVRDSGIGIAPEDVPRLFQPFAQVDSALSRRYAGSGLGLYLCRVLAEAQGATLAMESTPGLGTTVRLRFPAASILD